MNLTLSEDQILIRDSADKFLEQNYSFENRQTFIENKSKSFKKNWSSFSELGWLGLAFAEDIGGFDGNINNLMTLMESIGSSLVLEPLIFNNLIVGKLFEKLPLKNKEKYLKEIISGEKVYSLLFSPNENYKNNITQNLKIKNDSSQVSISGKYDYVFGLTEFDSLLIPIFIEDKIYIYNLNNSVGSFDIRHYDNIDDSSVSEIEFNSLKLDKKDLLTTVNKDNFFEKLDYVFDYATLSMCSQALGIIEKMYNLTLEYSKTREQFGKKIGSFQVIQHRLVDMHIVKEEMRSLNYMGQLSMEEEINRKKCISLNKIFLGTHAKRMSQDCIQLHGGMGVAKEMSIGHYFSRITTFCSLFGSTDYHKERYSNYD
ncbi:acyl-CoA dehydrogenase family protein [Alphaproteobacteria bacterium]|nr:acyl-CoA dehydrogenase family protein [Alphaproteobacteria bacterium]